MNFKTIKVGIKPDAIEKFAKVAADQAIEELIWNAIDAEATQVDVIFHRNALEGIEEIVVRDNGHGISPEDAETIFGNIGGSSKRLRRRSPNLDRPYHGKEGRGRYKAFSLGRRIQWHSRHLVKGQLMTFCAELASSKLQAARIGVAESSDGAIGCDVIITDLKDNASALQAESRWDNLVYRLAPYLIANPGIKIVYDDHPLDFGQAINRNEVLSVIDQGTEDEEPLSFDVRVLEWDKPRKASLFWCDENGVSLDETTFDMKGVRYSFSAYILSDKVRALSDEGHLAAGEMDSSVRRFKDAARGKLHDYFRQRNAEDAKHVAQRIRDDGIYPYSQIPRSPVEKAEQQVFDICAATIHEYLPNFENADKHSRQFTYRLLREALENSPTNLGRIFKEVLNLSKEHQEDFVCLLGKASLGAIISTAKTVTDRLSFITGLEHLLHDKTARVLLKERSQLHRMLVEELWVFGDEYTLGADDVSLKTVLNEHRAVLKLPPLDRQITKAIADLRDIPDLLLWRQYLRGQEDRFEHLVVELKRPTVRISLKEIAQVKRYADRVLGNTHFDKERTHWTFVVLSDEIASDAKEDVTPRDREPGHVHSGKYHDVKVYTWSQVIQEAKVRLNWIKSRLEFGVSTECEGMEYLQRRFGHLLPDPKQLEAGADITRPGI